MMKLRLAAALLSAAFLGNSAMLAADPASDISKTGLLKLASFNAGSESSKRPQMTIIPEGALEKMLGLPAKTPNHQQLAGRCGSSNYYCDNPGSTYCCGNSADGYYCAADVNGC